MANDLYPNRAHRKDWTFPVSFPNGNPGIQPQFDRYESPRGGDLLKIHDELGF